MKTPVGIAALVPKVKVPKPSGFEDTVAMQSRRLTGATPRLLRSYGEAPARYFKRGGGFLKLASGAKKIKVGGISV